MASHGAQGVLGHADNVVEGPVAGPVLVLVPVAGLVPAAVLGPLQADVGHGEDATGPGPLAPLVPLEPAAQLGTVRAELGPVGAVLGLAGAVLGPVGAVLGPVGAELGPVGAILGLVGAELDSSCPGWPQLGPVGSG